MVDNLGFTLTKTSHTIGIQMALKIVFFPTCNCFSHCCQLETTTHSQLSSFTLVLHSIFMTDSSQPIRIVKVFIFSIAFRSSQINTTSDRIRCISMYVQSVLLVETSSAATCANIPKKQSLVAIHTLVQKTFYIQNNRSWV
jgi:hypothetical protein